jgi:hypothetical protein
LRCAHHLRRLDDQLALLLGSADGDGGCAYFSSLGITTERVYPFIGDARSLPSKFMEGLVFCRLSDVLAAAQRIAAGHLFAGPPAG